MPTNTDDAIQHFIEHLRVLKDASQHTIRAYCVDLTFFRDYIDSIKTSLQQVTRGTIREFIVALHEENKAKRTVCRRISTLRSFFLYCCREQYIDTNPMEDIDLPKLDRKIPLTLQYEQVEHLLNQPDTSSYLGFRDRTIMELFYSSGIRLSELQSLNRQDIDTHNLLIKIRGKGKKERLIPITKNAAEWIMKYLAHRERSVKCDDHLPEQDHLAIFLNHLGTRITTRSIDRNFKKYLISSGLHAAVTPHTIRHTIATHWLENGMDLKTIQCILGHSCLATTTIYTHVSTKLKRQVYQSAHPRA